MGRTDAGQRAKAGVTGQLVGRVKSGCVGEKKKTREIIIW